MQVKTLAAIMASTVFASFAIVLASLLPVTAHASEQPPADSAHEVHDSSADSACAFLSKNKTASFIAGGTYGDSKAITKFDITGDKSTDRIAFSVSSPEYDRYQVARIYINGALEYTYRTEDSFYVLAGKVLAAKNGRVFIYMCPTGDSDNGPDLLFTYANGSLRKIADFDNTFAGIKSSHSYSRSVKVKGNQIIVLHEVCTWGTGDIAVLYKYKYKKGRLVRTGKTGKWCKPFTLKKGAQRIHLNKQVKAFYNRKCRGKAINLYKDQAMKAKGVYVSGKTCSLKVGIGGKTLWIKVPNKEPRNFLPIFRETYYAG